MSQSDRLNVRFWFIADIVSACAIVAFWFFMFFLIARAFGWIRSLGSGMLHNLIGVTIILIAGIVAFGLKLWLQRFYGILEVTFAVVVAWQTVANLQRLNTLEAMVASGAAVYLIVRGLDNWLRGVETRRGFT